MFSVVISMLHVLMSAVLAYVAIHQLERHDAVVWIVSYSDIYQMLIIPLKINYI